MHLDDWDRHRSSEIRTTVPVPIVWVLFLVRCGHQERWPRNNELGLHVYHKLDFRETGEFDEDEAILKLEL